MKNFRLWAVLALVALAVLPGCSALNSLGDDEDAKLREEKPVEVLYNEAADALEAKKYKDATRLFEEVERQHPYSEWAPRAELMAAFASYKDLRYDEALLALDRYIELHPGSENIDYALYLRAMCFYEQISDVARDQAMTKDAMDALEALIQRFPDSTYARDATLKRDLTIDHLAGKEMEIGRYYMNRGQVNAAINRFLTVIKDYQTTTHTPEALHRLVEAYMTLGLRDEAVRVAAVLGYNYPGSRWYQDSYALMDDGQRQRILDNRSWVDRTVESLFKPE